MARVIKAGGGSGAPPRRPAARLGAPAAQKRPVIEKEVYRAQMRAAEIRKEAEEERERLLAEGKRQAAQMREEAQSEGAAEAFAEAAAEALMAFRRRAERYAEAADDIRSLSLEVVRKVLGQPPKLSERAIRAIIEQGMNRLRARRKLRVQLPESRLIALNRERPALVAALNKEPDIVLETVLDVSAGYCRVVTEVGGALCSEQTALDTLAETLSVDEHAVAPAPKSALSRLEQVDDDDDDAGAAAAEPDYDDDRTNAVGGPEPPPERRSPQQPRPGPQRPATGFRGGVGLSVTAPDIVMPELREIQVAGARVRPLEEVQPDPDATMTLDVEDLREELNQQRDRRAAAGAFHDEGGSVAHDDDDNDDELDLHVDDSVPER